MLSWVRRLVSLFQPARHRLRDVCFEGEEGFVDFTIPIQKILDTAGGSTLIRVRGNTSIGEVGFDIEVPPEWQRQDADDGRLVLYWGTVRYTSIGAASDRFLTLLAEQYELPVIDRTMKGGVEFTAVGLHTDPRRLKTSRIDMKLFLDKGAEDSYAEFFTNLDLENQKIEFREKDLNYRYPLVGGLSA